MCEGEGMDVCSFLDVFGSSCSLALGRVCSSTVIWIVIIQDSCLGFESEWQLMALADLH